MKKHFLYPFILLLILASCDQPAVMEQVAYSEDLFLKDHYTLDPLGGSFSFQVNAAGSWTLSKPDWLRANRNAGQGMKTVSMSADPNTTGGERRGEIVINSSEIKRIQVSQSFPYAFLNDNAPFTFKWDMRTEDEDRGQNSVFVRSNLYWKLVPVGEETDASHFEISPLQGFGDATISVLPLENNLETKEWQSCYRLTCYVDSAYQRSVEGIPGVEADSISLLQRNYEFLLNGQPDASVVFERSNFQMESFNISLDPESGASPDWSIISISNSGQDWLNVTKEDANTLKVVPRAANVTKYDRTCQVTLEASTGARRYLDVRQEKYLFYFLQNGVETDLLNFDNEGGEQNVTFVSSGPWMTDGILPAGVEFNPSFGEGTTDVQIKCNQQNVDLKPLLNNIVVSSNDPALSGIVLKDTLAIRQKEYLFQITQTLDTLGSGANDTKTFVLQSSGPWKIESNPDWVEVSPSSGDKGDAIRITVRTKNENPSETNHRTDKIRVVGTLNSNTLRRDVAVVQMRTLFDLSVSSFSSVSAYSSPDPVCTTTLISSQDWHITELPNWISVTPSEGNASSKPVTLYFTVHTNTGKASRSGRAIITNSSSSRKQINFTQDGIYFSVSGQDFNNQPAAGASKQTQVTCYPTVSWSVLNVPDWVTPSKSSGQGDGTVTFTIQPNSGTIESNGSEARSGSAQIQNNVTADKFNISFSQAGYRWSVTNASSYKFGAFKGEKTSEFTITSSGSWRIDTPDWISASRTQGSAGTERITLTTIKDNAPASTQRSGTVTIVCNDFETLNKTIQVQQEKYALSASPASITLGKAKNQTANLTITADGAWTAKTSATWLNLSTTSGSAGTTTLVVKTTSKNSGRSSREAKIEITDTKYSSIPPVTITVTQSNK